MNMAPQEPTNTSPMVVPRQLPDGGTVMIPRFEWDGVRDRAATDIAEGTFRVSEIADRCGVAPATVNAWRKHPDFIARVDEIQAEMREAVKHLGIARVEVRVAAQNERWLAARQVIAERAGAGYDAPGASTGLLAKDVKQIGGGEDAQLVEIYAVDTGLLKEIRELEKHAAQELGQWTEKKEVTGRDGGPVAVQAIALAELMTPEELESLRKRAQERAALGNKVLEIAAPNGPAPIDVEPEIEFDSE